MSPVGVPQKPSQLRAFTFHRARSEAQFLLAFRVPPCGPKVPFGEVGLELPQELK